jgi:hypothetical protein
MKIIFLAYREWSLDVYKAIERHPNVQFSVLCKTQVELEKLDLKKFNLLLTCGTSDKLGKEILEKIETIGVHCAELDRYSYGSPIQNQIIDGINFTKHRIFKLSYNENSIRSHAHDRLFSHEVDLDLSGNVDDIFYQMTSTSIILFNKYLNDISNIVWSEWPEEEIIRKKRVPSDSKLLKEQMFNMSTKELYDFFRCLGDPYPNGYIEDEVGSLYINKVSFKKK